jgi:hypothetical protein
MLRSGSSGVVVQRDAHAGRDRRTARHPTGSVFVTEQPVDRRSSTVSHGSTNDQVSGRSSGHPFRRSKIFEDLWRVVSI